MSNLSRWEPVREMMTLREAMDRLFDDAFTRPFDLNASASVPAVDLVETDNELTVKATLPGVKPEDVQISVSGDILSLHGEFKQESEKKDATYHLRESRTGTFDRKIQLPMDVKIDQAKAAFENGILTITLPKAEEEKPRNIPIKVK